MGTLEQKWGPNGDPKTEKGPHGDRVPQMGTHVGTVDWVGMSMGMGWKSLCGATIRASLCDANKSHKVSFKPRTIFELKTSYCREFPTCS